MAVDYVSKWIEVVAFKSNDHKVVVNFLKENLFSRFGFPRAKISNGGKYFCNHTFEALMRKYCINHRVATLTIHRLAAKLKSLTTLLRPF